MNGFGDDTAARSRAAHLWIESIKLRAVLDAGVHGARLCDEFAMAALPSAIKNIAEAARLKSLLDDSREVAPFEDMARVAYMIADACMAERARRLKSSESKRHSLVWMANLVDEVQRMETTTHGTFREGWTRACLEVQRRLRAAKQDASK